MKRVIIRFIWESAGKTKDFGSFSSLSHRFGESARQNGSLPKSRFRYRGTKKFVLRKDIEQSGTNNRNEYSWMKKVEKEERRKERKRRKKKEEEKREKERRKGGKRMKMDGKCSLYWAEKGLFWGINWGTKGPVFGLGSELEYRSKRMLVWKALENLKLLRFRRRVQNFRRKSAI